MVTTTVLRKAFAPVLAKLNKEPPQGRIKTAAMLMEELQVVLADIAACRRSAVRELRAEGWTLQRIATETGISISRVKQIEDPDYERGPAKHAATGGKPGRPRLPISTVDPDAVIREALEDAGRG